MSKEPKRPGICSVGKVHGEKVTRKAVELTAIRNKPVSREDVLREYIDLGDRLITD